MSKDKMPMRAKGLELKSFKMSISRSIIKVRLFLSSIAKTEDFYVSEV